eukprot:TRINITY_DN2848_c0_g1_i7.p1 TRINITY_DN2848_c0_g1~~TRINITY_DN2848_c0_g1_i7.p1  ORF type:complete len:375 (-),score=76.55 TRINITY_DN2848_c0_g1_i7:103-1227(-)
MLQESDTIIDVFNDCSATAPCVGTNDDYCGSKSMVSFQSTSSQTYLFFVTSWSSSTAGITFTLTVQTGMAQATFNLRSRHPAESKLNYDTCYYSKSVELPSSWSGTTQDSVSITTGTCRPTGTVRSGAPRIPHMRTNWVSPRHTGKWFTFYNDVAQFVNVSTCQSDTTIATGIEVYTSCSMTSCVTWGTATGGACGNRTSIMFAAAPATTYHVFVYGASSQGWIHVEFLTQSGAAHSECTNAVPITSLPFSYLGETETAVHDTDVCLNNQNKQGMWFKFTGTGYKTIAHTCDQETDYDTLIEVLDGCHVTDRNPCIASNDDYNDGEINCARLSRVQTETSLGETYFLYVTGFGASAGVFMLDVFDGAPFPRYRS